ncbi:flagellin [Fibrobacterota bacterium]
MRINHNIAAMVTQNAGRVQNKSLQGSLEKLSTGLRINRASDDAAGLSVSESLRTQVRGLAKAQVNASDGIGLLQIAEGAANEVSAILQRMRELAIQSVNDTLTSTERGYTNTEFQALMTEISRISKSAQYNGMTLLDGASGSFGVSGGPASVLHIGANNNGGNVNGTVDTMKVTVDSITLGALGITLTTASDNGTNITNQVSAFNAITQIDIAINSINNMRADMGAYINRLDHAINNIANQTFNTQDAEARIRDVDFAQETTKFTRSQILTQSATAMLAQANAVPQSVLQLLV